jgi:hypothetical protein
MPSKPLQAFRLNHAAVMSAIAWRSGDEQSGTHSLRTTLQPTGLAFA